MFNVNIRSAECSIDVDLGSTILEAALQAGIDYPHGCRAGNCAGCKSRLHSGDVELSPYSEFALSDAEFKDGLILACRAVPWSNCDVSWCEPDDVAIHPVLDLNCEVHALDPLTHDIVSLKLKITNSHTFAFSSGQFVYVEFDGFPRREYSIASLTDDILEFYIRIIPGGTVSPFVATYLDIGERVRVNGPYGNMFYRQQHEGPVFAIAGGSGLSAIQPVVLESLQQRPQRMVSLYHGVRAEQDVFRQNMFNELQTQHVAFSYCPVLSATTQQSKRKTGMLAEVLDKELQDVVAGKAYLAGPPPMVRSCSEVLAEKGMDPMNIHADPFFTEADQAGIQ